jgi:ubiquinone/menaquinone biosynthesis C-methylase UbiE
MSGTASVHNPVYTEPFDAVADRYDEVFTESKIGQAQRASVWKEMKKNFFPGDSILEIGCGTGVDACFLASRGVRVAACDCSPRMLALTERRVKETGSSELVETHLLGAEEIRELQGERLFDGAFSNFGALNCVEDLKQLASDLGRMLRPGAPALFCVMGSCCAWELAWYLAHGNAKKAFRRFQRDGVEARLADGATVHVYYPSIRSLARTFAPKFVLKSVKGIGVAVPPSYLEPLAHCFPQIFNLQKRTDSLLGKCPAIRTLADHILLSFERTGCA